MDSIQERLKRMALEKIDHIIQSIPLENQLKYGGAIRQFASYFLTSDSVFHTLLKGFRRGLSSMHIKSDDIEIYYQKKEGEHTLSFLNHHFSLEQKSYFDFLSYSVEIMRNILPLGTLVELNPSHFQHAQQLKSTAKVIITGRFIALKGYQSYFPYVGVIYPIGDIKKDAKIYFTEPLIKRVLQNGYKDETEDAFIYFMKKDLIFDKGFRSFEFSEGDLKKLQFEFKKRAGEM